VEAISVVVCAHNSAARIGSTLRALSRCRCDGVIEIIVVDNNSTDDTASLAAGAWREFGNGTTNFRVVQEPRAGLAYARQAGIAQAHGDIVVFCDDDNWLSRDYLFHALRIMADPSVGAAGGCATPTRPERLPPWFYTFAWGFAVGVPFEDIADFPQPPQSECPVRALWGAGLVVRRDAILSLYATQGFPALTGRRGGALISGEDLELSRCLSAAGYRLVFSTALQFEHDIADDRLGLAYAQKLFANFGDGFRVLGFYDKIIEARQRPHYAAMKGLARIAKHTVLARMTRDSWLTLLAAFRLPSLMTAEQRRIDGIVSQIRNQRRRKRRVTGNPREISAASHRPA
jgi:glycosyltransferase involved in cell wall biosynthesis